MNLAAINRLHVTLFSILVTGAAACPAPSAGDGADADVGAPSEPAPPSVVDLDRYDPQGFRTDEVSLAGPWSFAFDPAGDGQARGLHRPDGADAYDETIQVPHPWQSAASQVGPPAPDTYATFGSEAGLESYNGVAWYSRRVLVPAEWPVTDRLLLRFGAVDWRADVWIDGAPVASHVGGSTPFTVDLTHRAAPGQTLFIAVRVDDPCTADPSLLVGKQGGIWYTCAGGIWQDVTLYHHPEVHLDRVVDEPYKGFGTLTSRYSIGGHSGSAEVTVRLACIEEQCRAPCGPFVGSATVDVSGGANPVPITIAVPGAPVWTSESPCLLGRSIEVRSAGGADVVMGYAGLRDAGVDWVQGHGPGDADPAEQYQGFVAGGRPLYVRAVLDQAYHPETLTGWPSRSFRVDELRRIRDLGFNAIRIHIKPEEPFVYAACDALGLWVIYDLPSPDAFAPSGPDSPWRDPWRDAMDVLIPRDINHPSILWWVLFNEAWGLLDPPFWQDQEVTAWVLSMYHRAGSLDPTRPVEEHSPGGFSEIVDDGALPHIETQVSSYHLYDRDPARFLDRLQALADDTFPGSTANFYGGGVQTGQPLVISEFGPLSATDADGDLFWGWHGQMNAMWRVDKIQGWVFTQWTDLEWETNGVVRYDRTPKEAGMAELGMEISDLLADPYLVLGLAPGASAAPGSDVSVALGVGSSTARSPGVVELELTRRDDGAVVETWTASAESLVAGFNPLPPASFAAPLEIGVYVLRATLVAGGQDLARNGMYLVVDDGDGTEPDAGRLSPGHCEGSCALERTVDTPGPGTYALTLVAEVASVDPGQGQTDGRALPSEVEVLLEGVATATLNAADAPHDHRGVLSHLNAPSTLHGAWGERVEVPLGTHAVDATLAVTFQASGNGLRIFARDTGRHLLAPRILFE